VAEDRRLEFIDFTEWAQAAHDRGLWLFGTSIGSEAHLYCPNKINPWGKIKGFWAYDTHKGWLAYEMEKAASGDSTT
jgi:hypothetical protein